MYKLLSPIKKFLFGGDVTTSVACNNDQLELNLLQDATNQLISWFQRNSLKFCQFRFVAMPCHLAKLGHKIVKLLVHGHRGS